MILAQHNNSTHIFNEMTTAGSAMAVWQKIENLPSDSVILLDIDDTIIMPVSKVFRLGADLNPIDEIKQNKSAYTDYATIVSNWRLQRKVRLVDEHWPAALQQIRKKFSVFGLTKIDSGCMGNIPSMEEWRYAELKNMGIEFSQEYPSNLQSHSLHNTGNKPVYYKGLFLTGSATKAQTLEQYREFLTGTAIAMVDDRPQQLEDIKSFCQKYSFNFLGILFEGMQKLNEKPDREIAAFQKNYLVTHAQWLEDEEALEIFKSF